MRIIVEGNFSPAGSYGIVNANLARALAARGHEVSLVSLDISEDDLARVARGVNGEGTTLLAGEPSAPADVRIRQIWPPVWVRRHPEERLVVIQPWEFGSIPLSWLDALGDVDAIWVPSEYCKRSYLQSGVDAAKVWVVPNGVDVGSAPILEATPRATKQVLYLGGTIMRKGVDVLVEALDALDDATLERLDLVVKDVGRESYYRGQSLLDDAMNAHPRVLARTSVISDHLDRRALLDLIANADVLVHPYRAEGFGLPVLEAMALGTLVVHTRGGATNEFCGPEESLLIPSRLTVAEAARVGDSVLTDQCYWYEPSREELSALIAGIVEDRVDTAPLVAAARRRAEQWSWSRVGEIAENALVALCDGATPSDALSRLVEDLSRFLSGEGERLAPLLSSLVGVGDLATALALASGEREGPDRFEVAAVRERLVALAASTADVWSAGPYRALVSGAQFRKGGHFAYAHDFEGDDQATYRIATHLAQYLSGCRSVLDIACGQGSMMRVLRGQGKVVQGIEADPQLVRRLRADGFTVYEAFVPSDLATVNPLAFDGVFLGHIAEHLTPAEFERVLDWVYENIADHGTVLIQTPDFATTSVALENFWLDSTHLRPYPVRLLKAMLIKTGFIPVEGACGPVRDVAPLDVIAVARRVRRSSRTVSEEPAVRTTPDGARASTLGHYALLNGPSGFSHASRDLLDADGLATLGLELIEVSLDPEADRSTCARGVPLRLAQGMDVDVAVLDVPAGWLGDISPLVRARHRIARTTFEATPLPQSLERTLRGFDEVWCFSHFDAQILTQSGIAPTSVFVMAPGVDAPDAPSIRARREQRTRDTFRFLSVFHFEPRKNPEALVRAFARVVERVPSSELVLKVSGTTPEDFEAWLHRTFSEDEHRRLRGRLRILAFHMTREALTELYLDCDVFVLPTRGEGYGLPFLEALAHGLATICPDVGGHREFCNEENSLLVRTDTCPASSVVGAGVFRESFWREVDADDLAERMFEAASGAAPLEALASAGLASAAGFSVSRYQEATRRRLAQVAFARGFCE